MWWSSIPLFITKWTINVRAIKDLICLAQRQQEHNVVVVTMGCSGCQVTFRWNLFMLINLCFFYVLNSQWTSSACQSVSHEFGIPATCQAMSCKIYCRPSMFKQNCLNLCRNRIRSKGSISCSSMTCYQKLPKLQHLSNPWLINKMESNQPQELSQTLFFAS